MQKYNETLFPTDYSFIVERINAIHPEKYAKTRNFLNGDITYLSPYISRGVITLKQVQEAIINNGFNIVQSEKLIQELAWREYYQRVWQEKGDHIWDDLKQPQTNVQHNQLPLALLHASTEIQIIDDQINSLFTTGYLHNHIRMYLASIVCNIGKAHWKEPAKWMYYHLFDGDMASNNCSWQWVAGSFSAKKYYCNQENINKYTNSQQVGTFLDHSYEQLVDLKVPNQLLPSYNFALHTKLPDTKLPIIDTNIPTLLYNSYNLDPNWRAYEKVNRVLILEPSHFNNYPISENVLNFILDLANNIQGIQVFCGETHEIAAIYHQNEMDTNKFIISKEHPAFKHYPGIKDERTWLFPTVTGYYPSFFNYWKKCFSTLH